MPEAIGWSYRNSTVTDEDDEREPNPALVITNTGAIRFDIFAGAFTKDSTFLVSPFTSGFRVLRDVPTSAAKNLLKVLNNGDNIWGSSRKRSDEEDILAPLREADLGPSEQIGRSARDETDDGDLYMFEDISGPDQEPMGGLDDTPTVLDLPPGYTTKDDAGSDGDDTEHSKIEFYRVPNCIQSEVGVDLSSDDDQPETVDVVYNEFIQKHVILALRFLGQEFEAGDTRSVAKGKTMTDYMTDWVRENWGIEQGEDCSSVMI